MKFRSLFLSALCGLAVSTAFTSCSDDEYDPFEYGSSVALPNIAVLCSTKALIN